MKKYIFILILSLLSSTAKAALTFEVETTVRPEMQTSITDEDGDSIDRDAFEDPTGIAFSNNGLKAFVTNKKGDSDKGKCISEITLTVPFDFTQSHTQTNRADVLKNLVGKTGNNLKCYDIKFSNDGKKVFVSNVEDSIFAFDLPIPFNLSGISYVSGSETDFSARNFDFNDDGTKLFTLPEHVSSKTLKEYSLATAYDITTSTLLTSTNLASTLVETVNDSSTDNDLPTSLEFSKDGSMLFILLLSNSDQAAANFTFGDTMFQFKLTTPFDTSTLTLAGSSVISSSFDDGSGTSTFDYSQGFTISPNGDKLFIVSDLGGPTFDGGGDSVAQLKLSCFFGIGVCRTDIVSGIGSHVEAAKRNIHFNNSTMFKRFEWIKRNRNNENLNSFNINLKSYNPILASLTNTLQASLNNNSSKIKSKTWSFWSTGDVSMGRQDATITDRPKEIHTSGLTFGADKKIGDNKFGGFALRYAQNDSSVSYTDQSSEMESLTLNLYGIIPKNETYYTNMILGYSLLRIDQKYQGKKTGNRNGHQLFASVNFRSKNKSGRFNFSPSGKFSYGLTKLSDFTDFISTVNTAANDQHDSKTLKNGNATIGFLFDVEPYEYPKVTVIPNGGFEFVMDISPGTRFNYDNGQSSTFVDVYSTKNYKANFGFEAIYINDLTLSMNFEKFQHLDIDRSSKTESLIIKIGKIIKGDSEFAFNYDPLQTNQMELNYVKDVNGFDVKVGSNYSLMNEIPEYGANIEVSSVF